MSDDKQLPRISRREAILRVSAMLGGTALVGQTALLAACSKEADRPAPSAEATYSNTLFTATDVAYLDEIADTILPETDTPGAKAAGVGPFIALMVLDCYYPADQEIVRKGLVTLNEECMNETGKAFMAATPAERLALLTRIDDEAQHYTWNRKDGDPAHYFRLLKELTLTGYFTSEIGYTQAMRYAETPGRYDPCAPYAEGETAWADHA